MLLCESFRKQAGRVWWQMKEASRLGISLGEETITETNLYNLARAHQSGELAIHPATKPQEAKHGADWEWWFASQGLGMGYRVQAKRLFPSGRYESLFKKSDPLGQIETLKANAKAFGLDALLCFYNYEFSDGTFRGFTNHCMHYYRGPSFWGCSLALPADVEALATDSLTVLQSAMTPWHYLACVQPGQALADAVASNMRVLADARVFLPSGVHRTRVDVMAEPRPLPEYVIELIRLGRATRDQPVDRSRRYLDTEFWETTKVAEREVAGIAVFDDQRPA